MQSIQSFKDDLNLAGPVMDNIIRASYEKPTPVQKHALPIGKQACCQPGRHSPRYAPVLSSEAVHVDRARVRQPVGGGAGTAGRRFERRHESKRERKRER